MLQSKYLFKLLFAGTILFCTYAFSAGLREPGNTVPSAKEAESSTFARQTLRKIYTSQVGVRERSGRNDGTRIEEYLKLVGLSKGNPYCAAFVCWCLNKAGIENPRSGWSPALFPTDKVVWERSRALHVSKYRPQAGDVFGIYFPDKKRIAHCGFVDEWSTSWVITVEANTNVAGSREGDGVYRKRRLGSSIYKVSSFVPTEKTSD